MDQHELRQFSWIQLRACEWEKVIQHAKAKVNDFVEPDTFKYDDMGEVHADFFLDNFPEDDPMLKTLGGNMSVKCAAAVNGPCKLHKAGKCKI